MLLVFGDLNARTGSVNTDRESVKGKEGFGAINNNGERLVEICQENNLITCIGRNLFQHKDIHKITWIKELSVKLTTSSLIKNGGDLCKTCYWNYSPETKKSKTC